MASRGVNKAILVGNLGNDPELRHTASGKPVANFNVATSDMWTNRDGQQETRTEWHRIVAWGKLAEICGEYLTKGKQVYVEGRIQTRSWEDSNGQTQRVTEIVASQMVMLGTKGGGEPLQPSSTDSSSVSEEATSEGGTGSDLPF